MKTRLTMAVNELKVKGTKVKLKPKEIHGFGSWISVMLCLLRNLHFAPSIHNNNNKRPTTTTTTMAISNDKNKRRPTTDDVDGDYTFWTPFFFVFVRFTFDHRVHLINVIHSFLISLDRQSNKNCFEFFDDDKNHFEIERIFFEAKAFRIATNLNDT